MAKKQARVKKATRADVYGHPGQTSPMRPEVGTQTQFRKRKPPQTYRYDSSLSPALDWDGRNGNRELGEWLLGLITTAAALPSPHVLPEPAEFRGADGRIVDHLAGARSAPFEASEHRQIAVKVIDDRRNELLVVKPLG